jgi:hypothetical protein
MTQAQRVMAILGDGCEHTHHEFYGFCVLHSRISELRKKGFNIACWRDGDNYVYQLLPTFETVREGDATTACGAVRSASPRGPSPDIRGGSPPVSPPGATSEAGFGPSPQEDPSQTQLPTQLSVFEAAA